MDGINTLQKSPMLKGKILNALEMHPNIEDSIVSGIKIEKHRKKNRKGVFSVTGRWEDFRVLAVGPYFLCQRELHQTRLCKTCH